MSGVIHLLLHICADLALELLLDHYGRDGRYSYAKEE